MALYLDSLEDLSSHVNDDNACDKILTLIDKTGLGTDTYEEALYLIKSLQFQCKENPKLDRVLGALHHLTSRRRVCRNTKHYADNFSDILQDDVRTAIAYLISQESDDEILAKYTRQFTELEGKGLMTAFRYANVYFRNHSFFSENLFLMYMRIVVFFLVQVMKQPAYYSFFKKADVISVFHALFEPIISQKICLCSPVLLNAGFENQNLTSCFIITKNINSFDYGERVCGTVKKFFYDDVFTRFDSVVHDILKRILQNGGGVGLDVSSYTGPNLFKYMQLLNGTIEFYNDFLRRPVGLAVSMEIWHDDIYKFLRSKMPNAPENERCFSLFNAVMIPDLFFKRYEQDSNSLWSLFNHCFIDSFRDSWGEEFEKTYAFYEATGLYTRQVPIKDLVYSLINTIVNTGTPYILFKDAMNRHYYMKSTSSPDFIVRSSNLCAEIVHHSNESEVGVCNLTSIDLTKFIRPLKDITSSYIEGIDYVTAPGKQCMFSLFELRQIVARAVLMINCAMDVKNNLPIEVKRSIDRYRSLAIGVQGLHTTFIRLGWSYTSIEARDLNIRIAESMYYAALHASMKLCKNGLRPFARFEESRYAKGQLHFDTWENVELTLPGHMWNALRKNIIDFGIHNSQFIAYMPTSGTSQLTGVSESYYPIYSNCYSKITTGAEVCVLNHDMYERFIDKVDYLQSIDWEVSRADRTQFTDSEWSDLMLYRNAFEYDQKDIIDMCADRAPFIDHSQSATLFVQEQNLTGCRYLFNLIRHAHRCGLKTGLYYLRVKKLTNLKDIKTRELQATVTPKPDLVDICNGHSCCT